MKYNIWFGDTVGKKYRYQEITSAEKVYEMGDTETAYQSIIRAYRHQLDLQNRSCDFIIVVSHDIYKELQWHELCKVCNKDIIYIPEIKKCVKWYNIAEDVAIYPRNRHLRFEWHMTMGRMYSKTL